MGQPQQQVRLAAYLGDADPHVAVPARRDDLSGLPPAWIGVGTATCGSASPR
ncbi:hypothetical protein MAHJHV57_54280 [Mycobacterium avium subsp. hominissuis]